MSQIEELKGSRIQHVRARVEAFLKGLRARKREIDNRVFKYVGVAGVDKPRIVQVGVSADNLPVCK